jgi:hypothetical protein
MNEKAPPLSGGAENARYCGQSINGLPLDALPRLRVVVVRLVARGRHNADFVVRRRFAPDVA